MADEKKEEQASVEKGGGAGIGMMLGMFITLAVAMGGFVVTMADKEAADPAETKAQKAEQDKASKKAEKYLVVIVNEFIFTFNGSNQQRGSKCRVKEIYLQLPFSGEKQPAVDAYTKDNTLFVAAGDIFNIDMNHRDGRSFMKEIKIFLQKKSAQDFVDPDADKLIGGELEMYLTYYLQNTVGIHSDADPKLGTVGYVDFVR